MKRTLVLAAVLVGFAAAANAVTLTVASDKTTYNVGETITLTVSGTDAGWPSSGASATGIFGRLQIAGSGSVTANTGTQKQVGNATDQWTLGVLSTDGSSFVESFNEVHGLSAAPPAGLPAKNPFATNTLIANAAGVVNLTWNTNTGSGFELSFFGLTNAPGTSFTILAVPEPTTVALVGLGLLGLALSGRRRA